MRFFFLKFFEIYIIKIFGFEKKIKNLFLFKIFKMIIF